MLIKGKEAKLSALGERCSEGSLGRGINMY